MRRPTAIPLNAEGTAAVELRAPRAFAPAEVQPVTETVES